MSDFKFACPECGQHITIAAEFESRRIDCPSCQTKLIVPPPPKQRGELPLATLAQPAARPKSSAPAPAKPKAAPAAPTTAATPPATKPTPAPSTAAARQDESESPFAATPPASDASSASAQPVKQVEPISTVRVAVLSPKIKLEIVRAMRPLIADEKHWMPGKLDDGQYAYAARQEGDKRVPVSPKDASATHLSLFGAVLREFHRYNVLQVSTGRRRFLDEELPAAIQQVLGRSPGSAPVTEAERGALTQAQCLAVLDVLEKRYAQEAVRAAKRDEERRIGYVRLADLVQKLEKKNPVTAEEVACALYHEVEEINQRLDALEPPEDEVQEPGT